MELCNMKTLEQVAGQFEFTNGAYGFLAGVKWQQEQIYNHIKELYDNENTIGFSKKAYAQCLDIVEQFKKK